METNVRLRSRRRKRLERKLILWRVVGLVAVAALCFGFAQSQSQKEIRLVSPDGRQSVEISPFGISLTDRGKTLGRIGFETIGDGDNQEVIVKVSGQVIATSMEARSDRERLFLGPERIGFLQNGAVRGALTPDGLMLQNKSGKTKINVFAPEQGTGGLEFVEGGNLILGLGSVQHFRGENPSRLNAGAIHIADFAKPFKSRLITADDSETHTAP